MNIIEKAYDFIRGGDKHERYRKKILPTVEAINAREPEIETLSDDDIRSRMVEIRRRVQDGTRKLPGDLEARRKQVQDALDQELVEVFALVREASKRALGMRHFDVQLVGGIVLHQGRIAEMRTGEGKTLVATLPVVLNALTGRGVHVVTVNDYLARRDAEWMGKVYEFLGLRVGCIQNQMSDKERRQAYARDITYGTNNELGFDYLRDNMKYVPEGLVQRRYIYAIVDEVDSILIDEARTPLIISGPSEVSVDLYYKVNDIIPQLTQGEEIDDEQGKRTTGDYIVDEKGHTAALTEQGIARAEQLLRTGNLYDVGNVEILHALNQALKAHTLFHKDVHYIVKKENRGSEVIIVDEFTGRLMSGRRWSDGLHQAVEAKEGVKIRSENQTLATVTLQNYFRMYEKLAGMTGTAETEAEEFNKIYGLEVTVIPTHKPMVRIDNQDVMFTNESAKFRAVVEEIVDCNQRGQPVLVGTVSVEKSERLAKELSKRKVKHDVLNAKYHEREAEIVAQAGRKGAVTIATNMAGRGTDIVLGGNPESLAKIKAKSDPKEYEKELEYYRGICAEEKEEVLDAGGLHIIGTERHESRRIDNQLRGRSGRQGDHGSSRFYLALEDDLMRIFAGERVKRLMERFSSEEARDLPIEARMVTKMIERAQKQVEGRNFESRKHLLEYDDVMNKQRVAVYVRRKEIFEWTKRRPKVLGFRVRMIKLLTGIIDCLMSRHCQGSDQSSWQLDELAQNLEHCFGIDLQETGLQRQEITAKQLRIRLLELAFVAMEQRLGMRATGGEGADSEAEEEARQARIRAGEASVGALVKAIIGIWMSWYGEELGEISSEELVTIRKRNLRELDSAYIACFGIGIAAIDFVEETISLAQLERALDESAMAMMLCGRYLLTVVRNTIDKLVSLAKGSGEYQQLAAEFCTIMDMPEDELHLDQVGTGAERLKTYLRIKAQERLLAQVDNPDGYEEIVERVCSWLRQHILHEELDQKEWNTHGYELEYRDIFGIPLADYRLGWHLPDREGLWEKQLELAAAPLDYRRPADEIAKDQIIEPVRDIVAMLVDEQCEDDDDPSTWKREELEKEYGKYFGVDFKDYELRWDVIRKRALEERLVDIARLRYLSRVEQMGAPEVTSWEKYLFLTILDRQWKDHLLALDHLREGIGLRAYAQRNPLVEYKKESFELFEAMWTSIEDDVVTKLFHLQPPKDPKKLKFRTTPTTLVHAEAASMSSYASPDDRYAGTPLAARARPTTYRRQQPKVGRNDPCPCGSGKKYKNCCLRVEASTGR